MDKIKEFTWFWARKVTFFQPTTTPATFLSEASTVPCPRTAMRFATAWEGGSESVSLSRATTVCRENRVFPAQLRNENKTSTKQINGFTRCWGPKHHLFQPTITSATFLSKALTLPGPATAMRVVAAWESGSESLSPSRATTVCLEHRVFPALLHYETKTSLNNKSMVSLGSGAPKRHIFQPTITSTTFLSDASTLPGPTTAMRFTTAWEGGSGSLSLSRATTVCLANRVLPTQLQYKTKPR